MAQETLVGVAINNSLPQLRQPVYQTNPKTTEEVRNAAMLAERGICEAALKKILTQLVNFTQSYFPATPQQTTISKDTVRTLTAQINVQETQLGSLQEEK